MLKKKRITIKYEQLLLESNTNHSYSISIFDFLEKELDSKVDDLDSTEDGEASEESHCPSNQTQLGNQGHLGK